jgi:hypothetical protein
LIALTMAMHGTGTIFMVFATLGIRGRLESQNRLELRQMFAINIGPDRCGGAASRSLRGFGEDSIELFLPLPSAHAIGHPFVSWPSPRQLLSLRAEAALVFRHASRRRRR